MASLGRLRPNVAVRRIVCNRSSRHGAAVSLIVIHSTEGNNLPVIVQIKSKPDAKTVIEKFTLNLSDCPGCDYLEYACTCDHGDHEGHDH